MSIYESTQHEFLDYAKFNDWDTVFNFINKYPNIINVSPSNRWTVLHQAAYYGNIEIIKKLLKLGAKQYKAGPDGILPCEVSDNLDIINLLGGFCISSKP